MSELEYLKEMVSQGFKPNIFIRKVDQEEVEYRKLPKQYYDKDVYMISLLEESTGKSSSFYMIEKNTIEYANELVEEANQVTGYNLTFCLRVQSNYTSKGDEISFEEIITSIEDIYPWSVELGKDSNTIVIKAYIDGDIYENVESVDLLVKNLTSFLCHKFRHGFIIFKKSISPIKKGNPITFGPWTTVNPLEKFTKSEFDEYSKLLNQDDLFLYVNDAINFIHSQITNQTKIAIGWGAIEKIFDEGKPKHLLASREIECIKDFIRKMGLEKDKQDKMINGITDSNKFSIKSRNERLAQDISIKTGIEYEYTKKQIKKISKIRGKMIHKLGQDMDIDNSIHFIEDLLLKYVENELTRKNTKKDNYENTI